MLQIPQYVIEMLSAKGKGYVEAAMKIAEGHKLVEEGTLEIAALDGKAMKAGGVDVTAVVKDLASPKTKAKAKNKIKANMPQIPRSIRGKYIKDVTPFFPVVKSVIKSADGWATLGMIQKAIKLSKKPCKRVLAAMQKDGLVKIVEKAHNPSHADKRAHNSTFAYWELAGGA